MEVLYIAYGAELDPGFMKLAFRRAKVVAKSWLHDHRLIFTGDEYEGRANIIPAKGYEVPVVVWSITLKQNTLAYTSTDSVYKKMSMSLEVDGEIRECLLYLPRSTGYALPTVEHLAKIIRGYKHYNFDKKYISDAVKYSYEKAEKEETA